MPKTVVFDVNETLLDLRALDPLFKEHFGDATMRGEWFTQVLLTSMTTALVGDYADFARVASAALGMVAERRGKTVSDEQRTGVLQGMRSLPAHPEARSAIELLKVNGYRIVTLTNSPPAVVEAQIENSSLGDLFDATLSVDSVRTFKPAPAVYDMAVRELGEEASNLWLVAAHNWDTTGALAAGWKAAFVARPGMVTGALDREPTVRADNLQEAAEKIIELDS